MKCPIGFSPFAAQRAIYDCKSRYVIAICGTRFGKTYSLCGLAIRRIFEDELAGKYRNVSPTGDKRRLSRATYWVVAPSYSLLGASIAYIRAMLPESLIERWLDSELKLWLKNGALIEFKSADDPSKLVSVACHGILADEAMRIHADAWRGQLRSRLIETQGWFLAASTPWGTNGWLLTDFVQKPSPDITCFNFPTSANPHIPKAELDAARDTMPENYWRRELLGDVSAFRGLLYPSFSVETHVITPEQAEREYGRSLAHAAQKAWAGIDFGFTNPTAIVVGLETTRDEVLIVDEVYETGLTMMHEDPSARSVLSEMRRLRAKWGISETIADSAAPDNISMLNRGGIFTRGCSKVGGIEANIRRLAERLHAKKNGRPGLRILSTCANTIAELGSLAWDVDREGNTLERPDPRLPDHAENALAYMVRTGIDAHKDVRPAEERTAFRVVRGPVR